MTSLWPGGEKGGDGVNFASDGDAIDHNKSSANRNCNLQADLVELLFSYNKDKICIGDDQFHS
ncbi:MAG: hypothetical protein ACRC67_21275 [Inquilinus sp.]|uniref:hypothetical protein n=1 Tax=Inquilinus sp. TaxID=1932117 RepID=UPI003F2C5524